MSLSAHSGAPDGRRFPSGAELVQGGVSFRVWAPARQSVSVVIDGEDHSLTAEAGGYFSGVVEGVGAGTEYRLRLSGLDELLPDPASRWQPTGPLGPSVVVDPSTFAWTDENWPGIRVEGQVYYEMHIGTFTPEGTWDAAIDKLPQLKELGITTVEVMPVNEFLGEFGWGYDGILPYAVTHIYGEPDGLRRFVDAAHALGLGVLLDVVYNHFGPGDHFEDFSPHYFLDGPRNEWGRSIRFHGEEAKGAREFFVGNALYFVHEFHVDGFRFDATQAVNDPSEEHVLAEMARKCRATVDRALLFVAENEPQRTSMLSDGSHEGQGLDALWSEDFHHTTYVAATDRYEGYMHDHRGTPQELVSAAKYGFLFQGQRYDWQDNPRGEPSLEQRPPRFVHYLQNHDQVANSARGLRFWQMTSPAKARALTAYFLLIPQTPLLFQGQEFAASTPFFYFLDSSEDMHDEVQQGRVTFLQQFPSIRDQGIVERMAKPHLRETLQRSKLDWSDAEKHAEVLALHRDLLRIRREHKAIARQPHARAGEFDGAVIGPSAFILRYFHEDANEQRLLAVNLGLELRLPSIADPLFAPPSGLDWVPCWSSEDPAYGGVGQRPLDTHERWVLTANSAVLFSTGSARPHKELSKDAVDRWQREMF